MKHQNIYNRLRRIEGQIRGVEEMVAKDRKEQDILIQLEAVRSSVSSTIHSLIESSFEKNEEGKISLSDEQIRAIIRAIK